MARVVVTYCFADGDQIQVAVTGKTTYPDALNQLRHEAIEGFRECTAHMNLVPVEIIPVEDKAE